MAILPEILVYIQRDTNIWLYFFYIYKNKRKNANRLYMVITLPGDERAEEKMFCFVPFFNSIQFYSDHKGQ